MAEDFVIQTVDVRKSYGGVQALAGVDLRIPRGAVCGLLGRNGAGKTTTIKVLLGMVRPTSGRASVFGLPATDAEASLEIRSRAAFVSEDKDLYAGVTVGALVRFTAAFYPKWRADRASEYLAAFELRADATTRELSRGMRTKLALLLALSTGAELLILDEPMSGLDPAAIEQVLKIIVQQAGRDGTTVLFSSHQLAASSRSPITSRSSTAAASSSTVRSTTFAPRTGAFKSSSTAQRRTPSSSREAS
ncbi:MAG TPA: ABC transporter ATP-binding protein [Gammaproteobacteria bacterium]|nr:ABC transporter ATP-binding protein [Gammaproteobacteria bacterium]